MSGEYITIQIGQCGNKVGQQFWSQLLIEHGLANDGSVQFDKDLYDHKRPFFKDHQNNNYTPRAILLDTEPSVIQNIKNSYHDLFNDRNIWVSPGETGAGNSWAKGYTLGESYIDDFFNIIDREVEDTNNLEGFQIIHSIAGGTGSGIGSLLLEKLQERYPSKLIITYSVFPAKTAEVVVQPYNSILTLRRLAEYSNAAIVFDNDSLSHITNQVFTTMENGYTQSNQLISATMSSITNSVRFPSYMYSSLTSIFSTLIPTPDLNFLVPSISPFTSDYITNNYSNNNSNSLLRNTKSLNVSDILLDLTDPVNSLITHSNKSSSRITYFNCFTTLIGKFNSNDDILRYVVKANKKLNFTSWTSKSMNINIGRRSPIFSANQTESADNFSNINGMMLSNSSTIIPILDRISSQFDKIYHKQAFINSFNDPSRTDSDFPDFEESSRVVKDLINNYKEAIEPDFLDDLLHDALRPMDTGSGEDVHMLESEN
ncbi:hypothetical protein TBLA_0E02010 [Henningerozyma blattae CBS 6284]|uniref:Tubulin gamma chain n=1 Tax=Henningerozyma blattae (strain ATCC 34711 / CBS 6284 / DSM 70876 / NBRC 10599 / NRRL Y-10934 / UCD 77-7) TaxID=1071380 RepID=I2H4F2_HENB6|nr:hypothetical protein TBLA_0E02010 [Tetrapisispora blattae CBS 6284]CCH61254.1 hypothetical protein TBLA_0E02010 [Tetrapisispora blattae CBS 6284]